MVAAYRTVRSVRQTTLLGLQYLGTRDGKWIGKAIDAINVSFELAYGRVPKRGKHRFVWYGRYLLFLGRLKYEGLGAIKQVTGIWEEHAAVTNNRIRSPLTGSFYPRGVDPLHTHIASTLKRAVHKAPSAGKIQKAESDTIERWMKEPTPLTDETLTKLYEFSLRYFGKPDRTSKEHWEGRQNQVEYPLPAGTKCIGRTEKSEVTSEALASWMKEVRMNKMFFTDDPTIRLDPKDELELRCSANPWSTERTQNLAKLNVEWSTKARIEKTGFIDFIDTLTQDPTKEEFAEECIKYCANLQEPPEIKVGSVVELGGKIRGYSIHPPQVTHAARCLGNRMIASVKRKQTVKEPLFNKPFTLRGKFGSRLVSADLSKATDYFQHEMTKAIVTGCADAQGWTNEELTAALRIYGPQKLKDGRVTMTGTHMGLAGTWAILNVANAYAAFEATRDLRTHKQCGDDLIGLFTPLEEQVYKDTLQEDLKLVYNTAKSYVGSRGRFCENHVKITHVDLKETLATCDPDVKIAEIVGAQELNGFTTSPQMIVLGLGPLQVHQLTPVRQGAVKALQRMERRLGLVPNLPLTMGGSGRKTKNVTHAQVNSLKAYIRSGSGIALTGQLPDDVKERISARNYPTRTSGFIEAQELRVHQLCEVAKVERMATGRVVQASEISVVAVRRQALRRARHTTDKTPTIHPSFLKKASNSLRNPSTFQNRVQQSARLLRKVANRLTRLHRKEYLTKDQVEYALEKSWSTNRFQNGKSHRLLGLDPPTPVE